MNIKKYQKEASRTDLHLVGYINKLGRISPRQLRFMHMALGISGEAGEIIDILKKHSIYGKKLNKEHLKEEIGDLMWYVANLANSLQINLEECLIKNTKKLALRYPNGYSHKDAIKRKDKQRN